MEWALHTVNMGVALITTLAAKNGPTRGVLKPRAWLAPALS